MADPDGFAGFGDVPKTAAARIFRAVDNGMIHLDPVGGVGQADPASVQPAPVLVRKKVLSGN